MAGTSFFTKASESQPSFIYSGENSFHALAIALIDGLKTDNLKSSVTVNTMVMNDNALKILLNRFFVCYPQYKTQPPNLTGAERMSMLINGLRKSEIVECMAIVLQQLAADIMYTQPLEYKEVFENLAANTANDFLRQPTTLIPGPAAQRALNKSLGLNISLSFVQHGKELRKRNHFNPTRQHELLIQVQDNEYFSAVKHKTDFAYVGQLAINIPIPVEDHEKTVSLEPILMLIKTDNLRLLQSYSQWCQNLLTRVNSNELTTANLMDLYIEFLPSKQNDSAYNMKLFSKSQFIKNPVTSEFFNKSNEQINELLVSSLAQWISTDQIKADQLFEYLENQSAASPSTTKITG